MWIFAYLGRARLCLIHRVFVQNALHWFVTPGDNQAGLLRETGLDDALPDKCPVFTSDENMPQYG